ncbi:Gfo/Idh/MocA family oxidoreductase [Plantactinospora sp. WMMB334]|uniref:Gfo/Idh/MocA family oxidoreductase n=1 Tax=Plantactinospora sp. WMMB334 TaxID=3404119 RepID=UPI003B955841
MRTPTLTGLRRSRPGLPHQEQVGRRPVRIAVVGVGQIGRQHLAALASTPGATVVHIVDQHRARAEAAAQSAGGAEAGDDLDHTLSRDDVDAVVLATPTPQHAAQAVAAMRAGKHVLVEIPVAESLPDARDVLDAQQATGLICMVAHTRRFSPAHRWIRERLHAGDLHLEQLLITTLFNRRRNVGLTGEPRDWTDNLLWHHAAGGVDLFGYHTDQVVAADVLQGPPHADLGIPIALSIQLQSQARQLLTYALSFGGAGDQGSWYTYVCREGTYLARGDSLTDRATGEPVDLAHLGAVGIQDQEFVASIAEGRQPESSLSAVWPCYEQLARLDAQLRDGG